MQNKLSLAKTIRAKTMIPNFIINPDPEIYLSDNYLVLDVENTIIDGNGRPVLPENRLLFSSIYHQGKYTGVVGGELELSNYLDLIYSVDFIVCHNAKHELQWLQRAGADISKILVYDTMIGEYVLAGNRKWRLNLDDTAKRYKVGYKNKYISLLMKDEICPSEHPQALMHKYCHKDVAVTLKVFLSQREELKRKGLLPVFFTRCIFTPVVAEMEMTGMYLDEELVNRIHSETVLEHAEVTQQLDKITGGINMASTQQVANFLYRTLKFKILRGKNRNPILGKPNKSWPEGMPKVNEDTLSKLKAKTKKQKEFIALRSVESKLRKRLTSYTRLFTDACENHGCMLHGRINQTVTSTHRLSSSAPNLQNIDRNLKKVVTARNPGWKVRQNDYAQLEFRVAGFLAQDDIARKVITDGEDPHAMSATMIFGESFTEATGEEKKKWRTKAKAHTFKPLYGGTSGTEEEQAYYQAFLEKYSRIKEWHGEILEEVLETGKLKTITGLVFYFPNVRYTNTGYIEGNQAVKNYPVQMLATADIATIGATLLWHMMKDANLKSFMINEVHDSVIIEEHPEENEILGNLSTLAMSKGVEGYLKQVYDIDFNFPLEIDQEVNDNWGYDR